MYIYLYIYIYTYRFVVSLFPYCVQILPRCPCLLNPATLRCFFFRHRPSKSLSRYAVEWRVHHTVHWPSRTPWLGVQCAYGG